MAQLLLWQAGIYSSIMCSVPVVGVTAKCHGKNTRQVRALLRQTANLSHAPNRDIWNSLGYSRRLLPCTRPLN